MARGVAYRRVDLPEFGVPTVEPEIRTEEYEARIRALRIRAEEAGDDAVVVYGDREHSANMAFLTGFAPRFEEALLVLAGTGAPVLVVGNEGMGFSRESPVSLERVAYPHFSLMGQDRRGSRTLAAILAGCGIRGGTRVGVVDWKYFTPDAGPDYRSWLNAPAYIAEALLSAAGERPRNATALLMDPVDGMRAVNSADQLARFEFAAAFTTEAMRRTLVGLRDGMTELEAAELARWNCLPFSCHPVMASGPRAEWVGAPSMRRMRRGEPVLWSLASPGALSARAGFLASSPADLPAGIADYVERLVAPYFHAAVDWYRAVGIGITGGALDRAVRARIGDPFFGLALNPGHLIHLDEWVHSPIYPGSDLALRSGMAIQLDIIPSTGGPYYTSNVEDGIALADEPLRRELAARWPEAWARIQARRRFMAEALGVELKPEVLPFSNIPGYLPPLLLSPDRAMATA